MKLELYLLKQLVLSFVLAVGGMMFVALPGIAVAAVHKLAGVDLIVVLRFLPLLAAGLIPYVLPIGYLLAVVVTFGRLAADNEWTAILMCGRNPWRMLVPALLLGGVLAAGTYGMVSRVLPYLKKETRTFQIAAVSDVIKNISPGRTEIQFGDFYLSASFRDGDEFIDALIHFPGERYKMIAQSVRFEFIEEQIIVHLENYQVVAPGLRGRMEKGTLAADIEALVGQSEQHYRRPKYRPSPELLELIRSGTLEGKDLLRAEYEFHSRFSVSVRQEAQSPLQAASAPYRSDCRARYFGSSSTICHGTSPSMS